MARHAPGGAALWLGVRRMAQHAEPVAVSPGDFAGTKL
jgi:hypothetical protein